MKNTHTFDTTGEATARFLKGVAAGKLDLAESISEVAAAGMEKLCTPAPLGFADSVAKQMLQPGAVPAQVMQGLADQLLERSLAITKMLKVGIARTLPTDPASREPCCRSGLSSSIAVLMFTYPSDAVHVRLVSPPTSRLLQIHRRPRAR